MYMYTDNRMKFGNYSGSMTFGNIRFGSRRESDPRTNARLDRGFFRSVRRYRNEYRKRRHSESFINIIMISIAGLLLAFFVSIFLPVL